MTERAIFVSVRQFAPIVGLSERTCWNLIHRHVLPVHRIGRRVLVKVDEGAAAIERIAANRAPDDVEVQ